MRCLPAPAITPGRRGGDGPCRAYDMRPDQTCARTGGIMRPHGDETAPGIGRREVRRRCIQESACRSRTRSTDRSTRAIQGRTSSNQQLGRRPFRPSQPCVARRVGCKRRCRAGFLRFTCVVAITTHFPSFKNSSIRSSGYGSCAGMPLRWLTSDNGRLGGRTRPVDLSQRRSSTKNLVGHIAKLPPCFKS